jgi:hypothetical protein
MAEVNSIIDYIDIIHSSDDTDVEAVRAGFSFLLTLGSEIAVTIFFGWLSQWLPEQFPDYPEMGQQVLAVLPYFQVGIGLVGGGFTIVHSFLAQERFFDR